MNKKEFIELLADIDDDCEMLVNVYEYSFSGNHPIEYIEVISIDNDVFVLEDAESDSESIRYEGDINEVKKDIFFSHETELEGKTKAEIDKFVDDVWTGLPRKKVCVIDIAR